MPSAGLQMIGPQVIGARIVGFTDHLRMNGFKVGPGEAEDVLRDLARGSLSTVDLARQRLKTMLCGRREEWQRFDDLFEAYWLSAGRRRRVVSPKDRDPKGVSSSGWRVWRDHLGDGSDLPRPEASNDGGTEEHRVDSKASGRLIATLQAARSRTDLRQFADPNEIAEAERLAFKLATALRYRLSRRYRAQPQGTRLDLRRTIRVNMGRGGEPVTLIRKSRPDRPVRLVVFLDVSGSMKAYSRFFLQFVKGLVCSAIEADAYLVHTRLVRVTDAVRERDSVKAMTRLSLMSEGFGGGTKLGACLGHFNRQHAKRALNGRSVVMILSDGYDTGTPELLAQELAHLKRRARRLVWLNPLLGWRDYRPVTAAMAAALPHIDCFAAANTLEALAAIEPELARL